MTRQEYISSIWNLNGMYWDQILMDLPGYIRTEDEFYDWIYSQLGI